MTESVTAGQLVAGWKAYEHNTVSPGRTEDPNLIVGSHLAADSDPLGALLTLERNCIGAWGCSPSDWPQHWQGSHRLLISLVTLKTPEELIAQHRAHEQRGSRSPVSNDPEIIAGLILDRSVGLEAAIRHLGLVISGRFRGLPRAQPAHLKARRLLRLMCQG